MNGSVVVVCMYGIGHFNCLLPVIAGLVRRGVEVHVLTRSDLRDEVERAGARFADLYDGRSIEAVDHSSIPVPSRNVTFAAAYAEPLAEEIADLGPALVIYETFAVIAPLVARRLGVPYVNVSPNHALVPERATAAMREDARVATSPECQAAVERLRDEHGVADASPFSYLTMLSSHLNLYPEPAEFLGEEDRRAFEPIEFFGVLEPPLHDTAASGRFRGTAPRRLFVSFGTIVWTYYEAEALAALRAVADAAESLGLEILISLGGVEIDPAERATLERSTVTAADYVDQWAALREADLFLTHHGINSTHEAIWHEVPMLSYPFFGDQPALARRCQELGLAVPLADEPRGALSATGLEAALERLDARGDGVAGRLAEARAWEVRTIEGREAILDRMLALGAR